MSAASLWHTPGHRHLIYHSQGRIQAAGAGCHVFTLGTETMLAHLVVTAALTLRILYRRLEVNTALAWIVLLVTLPLAGPALYIFFGDHSLGARRLKLGQRIRTLYQKAYAVEGTDGASLAHLPEPFAGLSRAITRESGFPLLARNAHAADQGASL